MGKLSLQKLIDSGKIKGKKVLVRVDFNVPIDADGVITDDKRILESLPTINAITSNGGKCILMSHLGRPKGEKNPKYSLEPVAKYLSNVLDKPVLFSDDCISEDNKEVTDAMNEGDILLLENLRFYKEEEKNDAEFSKKLASIGDVYVNDAFGTAHRAHASTEGVTKFMKDNAAGFLIEKELKYLSAAMKNPKRPLVAIMGGSKISGKIDVLENLIGVADSILIGGGMMFTFYKALGYNIAKSILEEDKIELAKEILEKAKLSNTKILLPEDVLMANRFDAEAETKEMFADRITPDFNEWIGVDIGPKAIHNYREEILKAGTVIWNGPMGVFEIDIFATGTMEVAKALAEATGNGAVTIVGGGDSASAIAKAGLEKSLTHVSTGGGASLEYLEGKELPGIAALTEV
ncbi:MAG: phosphoglycerate kinase [Ignavibacteria bacterium]|nr:phosphoglycerate kinase [Ignavibacteria bacterium]